MQANKDAASNGLSATNRNTRNPPPASPGAAARRPRMPIARFLIMKACCTRVGKLDAPAPIFTRKSFSGSPVLQGGEERKVSAPALTAFAPLNPTTTTRIMHTWAL